MTRRLILFGAAFALAFALLVCVAYAQKPPGPQDVCEAACAQDCYYFCSPGICVDFDWDYQIRPPLCTCSNFECLMFDEVDPEACPYTEGGTHGEGELYGTTELEAGS